MINSKKLAIKYLESLENFGARIHRNLSLEAKDFKFIKKSYSNTTKSRYYMFVTKEKHSYEFDVFSNRQLEPKEFNQHIGIVVRISDHPDYMNGVEWNDEEFEGKILTINEVETGDSIQEAVDHLEYYIVC